MNDLMVFNNVEFGEIRVVNINNEPYFIGKDVAGALQYKNTRDGNRTLKGKRFYHKNNK